MSTPFRDTAEAANTAASVTIHGKPGLDIVIYDLVWSYTGAGAAGGITIVGQTSGKGWGWDGLGAGYGAYTISADGIRFQTSEDVVVTLNAGGAGVTGKLNVGAQWRAPE